MEELIASVKSLGAQIGPYATVHLVLVNWFLNQVFKGLWDWGCGELANRAAMSDRVAARLQNVLTIFFVWLGGWGIVVYAPGLTFTWQNGWVYGTLVAAVTWMAHAKFLYKFEERLPWLKAAKDAANP